MYNDNPDMVVDQTDEVYQKLLGLKDDMVENINELVERDGKIEVIDGEKQDYEGWVLVTNVEEIPQVGGRK